MSNPRGRAARVRCMISPPENLYEIPRATAARARCASSLPVNSTVLMAVPVQTYFRIPPARSETGFGILSKFQSRTDLKHFQKKKFKIILYLWESIKATVPRVNLLPLRCMHDCMHTKFSKCTRVYTAVDL